MYFIAPAIVTALTGFVYLLSGSGAKSLTSRLLEEMLPEDVIDVGNPRVKRLVRVGAQIYGLEQIVTAGLTVLLVVNVSTTTYLAVHPFLSWAELGVAIALGTVLFRLDERRQPGNGRSVATPNLVPRLLTGAPA